MRTLRGTIGWLVGTLILGAMLGCLFGGCSGSMNPAGPSNTADVDVSQPGTQAGMLCTPTYHPRGCPQPSVSIVIVGGK